VTLRAAGLLVFGAGFAVWGWYSGWPELTALAAAGIALVVLVVIVAGPAPQVEVTLDEAASRVVRGEEASVRMTLQVRRRWRWLRVVEGSPSAPVATSPVRKPGSGDAITLRLPGPRVMPPPFMLSSTIVFGIGVPAEFVTVTVAAPLSGSVTSWTVSA